MEIRKASVQDLGQIMQVYDKARKFMRENGNAEQWGEDYPSAELIEHDIDVSVHVRRADCLCFLLCGGRR